MAQIDRDLRTPKRSYELIYQRLLPPEMIIQAGLVCNGQSVLVRRIQCENFCEQRYQGCRLWL